MAGIGAALVTRARRAARAIDFSGRSIVIVGGSRGLGLVLARQFAREGARLTLVARDPDELERARQEIARTGARVAVVPCDIRERSQVDRAIARVIEDVGSIDVLINDAGVIQVGPVEHMTLGDFEDAMATHFWGPLFAIHAALPYLRRSRAARIVNISSIGGKIAVPHLLPYSASKFALTGLSEGLHAELAKAGIHVTTVCPGLMRTGSTYNATFKGQHRREFAWFHVADSLPGLTISAERAAAKVIDACRHADAELIITPPARLAVILNAVCPRTMACAMAFASRLLPTAGDDRGNVSRTGWQSVSSAVPSALTRLSDRATMANNELPDGA